MHKLAVAVLAVAVAGALIIIVAGTRKQTYNLVCSPFENQQFTYEYTVEIHSVFLGIQDNLRATVQGTAMVKEVGNDYIHFEVTIDNIVMSGSAVENDNLLGNLGLPYMATIATSIKGTETVLLDANAPDLSDLGLAWVAPVITLPTRRVGVGDVWELPLPPTAVWLPSADRVKAKLESVTENHYKIVIWYNYKQDDESLELKFDVLLFRATCLVDRFDAVMKYRTIGHTLTVLWSYDAAPKN